MALVYDANGENPRLAQVTQMEETVVSLQVYGGTKGISTRSMVSFLGEAMQVTCSENILGRVFSGAGVVVDGGPVLADDPKTMIGTPSVNPMKRSLASKMIRTNLPMIDVFNCLVESQKIPIFSVAGEPYNALLARIAVEADADMVIFGGMGLMNQLPIERFWRDARVERIWDGTSEIQRHIISRAMLRVHGA
jgi:V/A-type H+-transporting ATPase subunit B